MAQLITCHSCRHLKKELLPLCRVTHGYYCKVDPLKVVRVDPMTAMCDALDARLTEWPGKRKEEVWLL